MDKVLPRVACYRTTMKIVGEGKVVVHLSREEINWRMKEGHGFFYRDKHDKFVAFPPEAIYEILETEKYYA